MTNVWTRLMTDLRRERFLAFTNIFVMTITFLVLGFFVCVVFVMQSGLKYLENQAQITAFFKDDFSEANILNLKDTLQKDERVLDVTYVSKEEAFRIFMELNKDEPILLESISVDVLPASLEVKTKNVGELANLTTEIEAVEGVEDVKYFRDVIERFKSVRNLTYSLGGVLVVVFLVLSYSLVISTLKLTISSKGTELEIQKLVGASDKYVQRPLLIQGIFFGLCASAISWIILMLTAVVMTVSRLTPSAFPVPFAGDSQVSILVFVLLLGFVLIMSGIFLGYFGSRTAIKKYLSY